MSSQRKSSAFDIASQIRRGEVSCEEHISKILENIQQKEPTFHAYIRIVEDSLDAARKIDQRVKRGEKLGKLCGLGVAIKDNISTKGIQTTCASRMLLDYVPPYDATVVERIRKEDGIILGKTNMDEFGMGSTTEFSYFGPTKNPLDPTLVAGGSSGGSAAAVSLFEADLALGSDTGGSVRCPASFCSIVGLKPTYGRVSRYGLISYASSLEQIGQLGRTADDCALLLDSIEGYDTMDSTSLRAETKDNLSRSSNDLDGVRIGVIKEFMDGTVEPVSKAINDAIGIIESLGATSQEVSLPSLRFALSSYYIIAMSEASSNLARYDGLRYGHESGFTDDDWQRFFSKNRAYGFGSEVKKRLIIGTFVLIAGYYERFYLKAQQARSQVRNDFIQQFKNFDVLVGPTMPLLPFRLGEKLTDPLALYMCDIDTVPANLAGIPSISVPVSAGTPIGLQILGPILGEEKIISVARIYEEATR
ncbi:MAG: Asp-tRNA(Asn)/Glu-tRNA(Gln) amidotransferase subunit GatA [Nitrososphaerales archaeon]